jgi:spermidine/putrescine transport system substrate-binding protein
MGNLTRRNLILRGMAGASLLSVPGLLAACGGGDGIEGQATTIDATAGTSAAAEVDRTLAEKLVISNWPLYIDIDDDTKESATLTGFSDETGVEVEYIEDINDNDEFFGVVQGPLSQGQFVRDIAMPTGYMVARMLELGFLEKWDLESVPNISGVSLTPADWNPNFEYAIPWQSYMTGIGWNAKEFGDTPPTVEQMLTDPALKGKVTMLNSMGDTIGLMLMDAGQDSTKIDPAAFEEQISRLQAAVDSGQIRQFTGNDYTGLLAKGDIIAAIAWSGDIIQLQADNADLRFAIPETGGGIGTDYMVVLKGGNVYTSSVFANYVLDPKIAAQIALYVNFVTPVAASKAEAERVDPDVSSNQLIFPDEATLANLQEFDPAALNDQAYNESFQAVIGN